MTKWNRLLGRQYGPDRHHVLRPSTQGPKLLGRHIIHQLLSKSASHCAEVPDPAKTSHWRPSLSIAERGVMRLGH